MNILKQQQFHISSLKEKISLKKTELDENNQLNIVREKEDELKFLRKKLKALVEERETVVSIKNGQEKALQEMRGTTDQEMKKKEMQAELQDIKQENKLLVEKKQELERELKKNHSKMFDGKILVRDLKRKIEQHKKRFADESLKEITDEDIEKLREQIWQLDQERKEKAALHDQEMRDLEMMRRDLEREHERLQRILGEKDREMRMNSLKLKELKRLQRIRSSMPIRSRQAINRYDRHE